MVLARDVFQVKYGQMDAVLAAFKEAAESLSGGPMGFRILTDVSGPHFTLVIESIAESVDAHRARMMANFEDPELAASMGKISQFFESGRREYYTVEYDSEGWGD